MGGAGLPASCGGLHPADGEPTAAEAQHRKVARRVLVTTALPAAADELGRAALQPSTSPLRYFLEKQGQSSLPAPAEVSPWLAGLGGLHISSVRAREGWLEDELLLFLQHLANPLGLTANGTWGREPG